MKLRLARQHVPLVATTVVCLLLYGAASLRYDGFCSWAVLLNLFRDNAFLGLAAIGMTFVILSGGIDLSVGAMVGCTSILLATLMQRCELTPFVAIPAVLMFGAALGLGMGAVVHFFGLPPFLVTLAGMFLARGIGFVIDMETVSIRQPLYDWIDDVSFTFFPIMVIVFLAALLAALYVAHQTRFGRAVYAVGGSESSALLMGLPVGRTKVGVYTLSGFCSAMAGVLYTFYTSSGNPNAGTMLELDAIAAVVIGGTLLTGGVGNVFGTLIGVLIFGIIQTAITFEGTLSSWWTRIAIGGLLLAFILLQKLVQSGAAGRRNR
ncbi:MAG: sugar ABC transporter permease YjfF [Phycisphaerae bacterium]